MKNRSSAGVATFDTFENPVTDGDDEPVLDGERSPSEGDRSPSEGDRSPSEGDHSPSVGDRSPSEGDRSPAGPDQLSVFEMESAYVASFSRACVRHRAAVHVASRKMTLRTPRQAAPVS